VAFTDAPRGRKSRLANWLIGTGTRHEFEIYFKCLLMTVMSGPRQLPAVDRIERALRLFMEVAWNVRHGQRSHWRRLDQVFASAET
jgi:hypothetical protein